MSRKEKSLAKKQSEYITRYNKKGWPKGVTEESWLRGWNNIGFKEDKK